MLYVDIPTRSEFATLVGARADACVSLYLKTTPVTQETSASRIEFGNLIREAQSQLEDAGFDKRRLAALLEQLNDLVDEEGVDEEIRHLDCAIKVLIGAGEEFGRVAVLLPIRRRRQIIPVLRLESSRLRSILEQVGANGVHEHVAVDHDADELVFIAIQKLERPGDIVKAQILKRAYFLERGQEGAKIAGEIRPEVKSVKACLALSQREQVLVIHIA